MALSPLPGCLLSIASDTGDVTYFTPKLQREGKRIGERRSICVEKMTYASDGTIPKLPFWSKTGPDPIEPLNPYAQTEAETMAWAWDVKTETCSEGGMDVTAIENGDYIKLRGVDFGSGATSLDVRVASAGNGGSIEVRLDGQTGKLVGTCAVSGTGGVQAWATKTCAISGASGVHDLFFVFTGGSGSLFNFNWWKFSGSGPAWDGGAGGGPGRDAGDAASADGSGAGGNGRTSRAGGAGGAASSGMSGGQSGSRTAGAGGFALGGSGGSQSGSGGGAGAGTGGTGSGGEVAIQQGGASAGGTKAGGGAGAGRGGGSAGEAKGSGGGGGAVGNQGGSSGCACTMGGVSGSETREQAALLCLAALPWARCRRRRRS